MFTIQFFVGLSFGLIVCFWQHYLSRKRLRELVNSFSSQDDRSISLPPMYLVRRELENLQQQRKQVAQERDNWQRLIDRAPIGYLLVDEDNQLLWCNQQARILLELDRWRYGEVRLLLELVRSYELDRLIELTRESQQPQKQEWVFYHTRYVSGQNYESKFWETNSSSGKVKSIALQGHSFPLPSRQIGVFLTDRQPLVELSRDRDRAISDLSHELKTPLTSISLVAENLLTRLQNPEKKWVEQMLKEAERLINLVQEWLDLAQLESKPLKNLKYESVAVAALIKSIWQTLEPIAKKKQIRLTIAGDELLAIAGDKSRLIQVFLNLLDNAIKHSPPKGKIIVRIGKEIDRVASDFQEEIAVVDIIDSGTGFESADLPYVFERLYRGEKSRTRQSDRSGGSGLGLAIVQQIIQAHDGAIDAQNHPDLGGAWLKVKLPVNKKTS